MAAGKRTTADKAVENEKAVILPLKQKRGRKRQIRKPRRVDLSISDRPQGPA